MKVLVTGGNGFIGRRLCASLVDEGHAVVSMSRSGSPPAGVDGVEGIAGSVVDRAALGAALKGVELVYHLAAITDESLPFEELLLVNVDGTRNVLATARGAGVGRVVIAGSVGVYGDLRGSTADEARPFAPQTPYEKSKRDAELAARDEIEKGTFAVTVRPTLVYGAGSMTFVRLLERIEQGKPQVGDGKYRWPLVHVSDVVAGIKLAGERPVEAGDDFILAGPSSYPYREVVRKAATLLGCSEPRFWIPELPLRAAATFFETAFGLLGRRSPLRQQVVDRFVRSREFSNEKAARILGYRPTVGLDEGMADTVEWYRNRKEQA